MNVYMDRKWDQSRYEKGFKETLMTHVFNFSRRKTLGGCAPASVTPRPLISLISCKMHFSEMKEKRKEKKEASVRWKEQKLQKALGEKASKK